MLENIILVMNVLILFREDLIELTKSIYLTILSFDSFLNVLAVKTQNPV